MDELYVYDRWEQYLKVLVRQIEIPREGLTLVCTFDYKGEGPNPYPAPPPLLFALRKAELITADGRIFQFEKGSNCYRVSWIYDKSRKNYLSFSYTSDRLSKIQDNIGREITIAYSSNKIQVKYQGVTCVTYTLGGGKKPELTSVTVPINAQDNAVTEYSYGDGRNIRITYPSGGQSEYTVNKESRVTRSFHRASNGGSIIKDLTYTYLTNTNNIYPYSVVSYISSNGYQIEYKYIKRVRNPRWTGPYTTGPDSNEYIGFGYSIENERIHKDANGTVLTKTVRTYSVPWYINIPCLIQEDEYRGSTKVYSKSYKYDDFAQLLYEKDPLGHEKYYAYAYSMVDGKAFSGFKSNSHGFTNAFYNNSQAPKRFWLRVGEAEKNTDGLTRETYYRYDSIGNLIEKKEKYTAAGKSNSSYSWRTTKYQYDSATNNLVKITDPAGNITEYIYDSAHKYAYIKKERRQIKFAEESRWDNGYYLFREFTHDNRGRVTSQKTGLETSSGSPVSGNVSAVTAYEYDGLNRITRVKADGKTYKEYTYNNQPYHSSYPERNSLKITDALGHYTIKTYDGLDRLVHERVYDKSGTLCSQKKYEYHPVFTDKVSKEKTLLKPNTTSTSNMVITETVYDALGRVKKTLKNSVLMSEIIYYDTQNRRVVENYAAPNTEKTKKEYRYDWKDRLIEVKEYAHTDAQPNNIIATTTYTCDRLGNLTKVTNAENIWTKYYYNTLGQVEKTEYQGGVYELFTYDAVGNLTQKRDRKGSYLTYYYDSLNRLRKVTTTAYTDRYDYDPSGKVKAMSRTPASNSYPEVEYAYTFDARRRVTGVTQTIGQQPSQTKTYQLAYTYYDTDDLETLTVKSNGQTVKTLTYDWGRKEKTVREGTSKIAALVTNTSESLGTLGKIQYGNNILTTEYKYNKLLQPISINCGSLMTNNYSYSRQGDVTTWNRSQYYHDGLNRIINIIRPFSGYAELVYYAYDKLGNRISEKNNSGTKTYTYDAYKKNLLSVGDITYAYDANHNRIRKSQGSLTWQYEYDPENRLTRVLENGQEIGKYSYNPAGLRVKKIEDGMTTVYVYHDSQPIYEETFNTANQANLGVPARQELSVYLGNMKLAGFVNGARYYYLLDHLGSTKVVTNAGGVPVENLDYETFGSPKEPAVYNSDDGSFERCSLKRLYGDPDKTNSQNYLYLGAKWRAAMHHCPADEYCEIAASPTAADGAKVGRIYDNGSGKWKALVLSNSILLTPNKWYRISVKARAVTNLGTKYASAYLSYNAADNEGDQQVTKRVSWSASELAGGEWVRKYVIFQVPSTPNGAPYWEVCAYLYGHYGEGVIEFDDYRIEEFVTQPSGPPPETRGYEYTGKKRDSATGLYYFAQRYYDPEIGRFITEDPAKDGMNWFVYCRNNPLRFVDPTGLAPGELYESIDKAATEWAMEWNGQSINRNREYGSTIYMIKDEDGNIWYGYTKPREGSRRAVIPSTSIPKGAKPVARIHSHGGFDPALGHCNWTFSDNDRLGNEVEYVATPAGYLVKWDPSTGEKIPMSIGIPSDPTAGIYRVNNIDPPNPNDSFAYNLNFTIDFRSKIEGLLRGWGW